MEQGQSWKISNLSIARKKQKYIGIFAGLRKSDAQTDLITVKSKNSKFTGLLAHESHEKQKRN